jgi:membrane dipeptidase
VLGMMAIPFAVDPESPTLRRWLDHFDHAVAVMGDAHVGLGADLIFVDPETPNLGRTRLTLEDFARPEDYPALVDALQEPDYHGERLDAILSANWLRILRQVYAV